MAFGDAREEELRFLLEVERAQGYLLRPETQDMARREMIAWLLSEHLFFGPGDQVGTHVPLKAASEAVMDAMAKLAQGQAVERVRLSHKGRVRISELRLVLRSDRTRDRSGLLDGSHSERALRLAILDAGPDAPLAVAYLDANGLKQINDDFDHDAGNVYLGAYAEAVLTAVGVDGEAYRLHGGGDEVLVLLPGQEAQAAVAIVRTANAGLAAQDLRYGNAVLPRGSLCAGIVVVRDPRAIGTEVRKRADVEMKRAKEASGKTRPRRPRVAIDGQTNLVDL